VVINSQATRENVARAAYEAAFSGASPSPPRVSDPAKAVI